MDLVYRCSSNCESQEVRERGDWNKENQRKNCQLLRLTCDGGPGSLHRQSEPLRHRPLPLLIVQVVEALHRDEHVINTCTRTLEILHYCYCWPTDLSQGGGRESCYAEDRTGVRILNTIRRRILSTSPRWPGPAETSIPDMRNNDPDNNTLLTLCST